MSDHLCELRDKLLKKEEEMEMMKKGGKVCLANYIIIKFNHEFEQIRQDNLYNNTVVCLSVTNSPATKTQKIRR